jgi:beta-D-xylosidase 4
LASAHQRVAWSRPSILREDTRIRSRSCEWFLPPRGEGAGRLISDTGGASSDMNMRPGCSLWARPDCNCTERACPQECPRGTNPGRTHRFFNGTAVVPFGWGLSYTKFEYELVSVPSVVSLAPLRDLLAAARTPFISHEHDAALAPPAIYELKVTNRGDVAADDVVLGFLRPPGAGTSGIPLQSLFGFERVHLLAGASTTVTLLPSHADFSQVTTEGERVSHPGEYTVRFGLQAMVAEGGGFAEHRVTAA